MKKQGKFPVVILGAGLSGLLTAYRLKNAGIPVKVLEASDRGGGRIRTVRGGDNTSLEMGATWLGNQHQNLRNLLKELNLLAFNQYMEGFAIFEATPSSPPQRFHLPQQDPSFRIKGGTAKLIQALLKFFTAEEVSYNEKVKQILVEEEQIQIKTEHRAYSAAKAICCIPPALLVNSVKFTPELPEALFTEAKNTHTWMQESIKAGVVYKKPFWRDSKISAIFSNQGPVIEFYDHSDSTESKFALCGFLNPDFGIFDRKEREEKVIYQLKRLFGKEAGDYISYDEVVWQKEKFTNANTGETFLPHQNNGHGIFQEPICGGKIFFSNSETSTVYGGYMDGAVYAANQTAKKVIQEGVEN